MRPVPKSARAAAPPVAKKIPAATTAHGETRVDEYSWLRDGEDADVVAYLRAENAYTDAVMRPTERLQKALYREMLAKIKETDVNAPYREGDYLYYSRTLKGKQYPVHARRPAGGRAESREEVVLDLNELAAGAGYLALGCFEVSPDGGLLAYTLDTKGSGEYTLFVKNLRTGRLLPRRVKRVSSVAWAADGGTIFYVVEDAATKRSHRLFRHALGKARGELLYEEADETFDLHVLLSRSRQYVLVTSASHDTSEVLYLRADEPGGTPRVIEPRAAGREYFVDHRGDTFYVRSNHGRARNFRLFAAPAADPRRRNWREVVGHREGAVLEDVDLFAGHMVITEREDGLQKIHITSLGDGAKHYVRFREPTYTVTLGSNPEFNTTVLRFRYQSLVTPDSVYDYDMARRELTLLKRAEVVGGYDPSAYHSERVYAPAPDGTRVPVSLVYRKTSKRPLLRPTLLQGYGAYGVPHPVNFSSSRLSLLDRGVIYAVAHVRGGGEFGKGWHEQGRRMTKKNTFTDFIAAAEHLIARRYTSADRLAIAGGSAGGLLVGAVLNLRPGLCRAAILQVPFVDVLNTMLDASLPFTVGEYEEWGNPHERRAYRYIRSYSPYDNIAPGAYPSMLVKTSLNDSQVMYWGPAKYVARLRAAKTDNNPLLLKTDMSAGHSGPSGRYDHLRAVAFDFAFVLTQLGVEA